jgi:two-component system, LuxR family, response regulator TtrR
MSINIYVVDDDNAVRRSIGNLLLSRHYAVQTFASGDAFLSQAQLQNSGVVVLDLRLENNLGQGMSGLEVFEVLRAQHSPMAVLFLSGHGDIPTAVQAVKNGALAWLEKPCNDESLIHHIELASVHARESWKRFITTQAAIAKWSKLTERECEVAVLYADGNAAKEIARTLSARKPESPIDHRTVENHLARCRAKLEISNSNELQKFLIANDLTR